MAEAQLVVTRVMASSVGGLPDMVADGETGLLFQAGGSAALAAQISRLLDVGDLSSRLSTRAREVARLRHSRSHIAGALLAAYDEILNRPR